jgi:hypothetical protein
MDIRIDAVIITIILVPCLGACIFFSTEMMKLGVPKKPVERRYLMYGRKIGGSVWHVSGWCKYIQRTTLRKLQKGHNLAYAGYV